jgi:glycosyltransferase involved in cell wall biosynthesis
MALIYDISRLSTRILMDAPNGIDRIDMLLAGHLLRNRSVDPRALLFGFFGPRLFDAAALPDPLAPLERAWNESEPDATPDLSQNLPRDLPAAVTEALRRGHGPSSADATTHRRAAPTRRAMDIGGALARYAWRRGSSPVKAAPPNAVYLNASHFPLEWARHVAWLDERPDIRPAVFVYDLLPILQPQFFWDGEPIRHRRRLAFLARRGAAALATSETVAQALTDHLAHLGRHDLPIFCAAPPVAQQFRRPVPFRPELAVQPYFVVCGTIEPRKNHRLLIDVWKSLVAAQGREAPVLFVVGKRGWLYDDIVRDVHGPDCAGKIVEVNGLSTPAYRALLAQAKALLAPSWGEGFGLPVAEALSAGVPVIASDIPSQREQAAECAVLLDPARPDDWFEAVRDFASPDSPLRAKALAALSAYVPVDPARYLASVETFLAAL